VPKLDPNDVQQPSAADVAAAKADNTVNPATVAPVPPAAIPAPSTPFGSSSSSPFGGGMSGGMGGMNNGMGGMSGGMGGMGGGMGMGMNPQASMLQSTGGAMQEGGKSEIEVDKGFSNFINQRWRPLMAVIYMITCMTDFVIFPILWSLLQALFHGTVTSQWAPLTLQGAGLYHIAMGAVLGLAAYGRSQEKIAGKA
jgi:hypothetical protein